MQYYFYVRLCQELARSIELLAEVIWLQCAQGV